jgi:hypothetical protein
VGGQGTAAYREDHRTSLWGLHLHMVLADLSHYDRFCHGSYGINRIHMRSWILASTSSLDRLFLQSGELIIATTAQRNGAHLDEQKDEQIRHVHGGENQLETTTTREWAIGWQVSP